MSTAEDVKVLRGALHEMPEDLALIRTEQIQRFCEVAGPHRIKRLLDEREELIAVLQLSHTQFRRSKSIHLWSDEETALDLRRLAILAKETEAS